VITGIVVSDDNDICCRPGRPWQLNDVGDRPLASRHGHPLTRLLVRQPLALDANQRLNSSLAIVHAERDAVVVPELKFRRVRCKCFLAQCW
jgi:hypothetical protein